MNSKVLILRHLHEIPSEYKPPEYKPPKKCLRIFISPGLIFGLLRYARIIDGYVFLGLTLFSQNLSANFVYDWHSYDSFHDKVE